MSISKNFDKFLNDFKSSKKKEEIRQAIVIEKTKGHILKSLKEAQGKIEKWFGQRLYSLGKTVESLETIISDDDFGCKLGIGLFVRTKKIKKTNVGRYLTHLLLLLEATERKIEYQQKEIFSAKKTYFDMENVIIELLNDENVPKSIKKRFNKFHWLLENFTDENS